MPKREWREGDRIAWPATSYSDVYIGEPITIVNGCVMGVVLDLCDPDVWCNTSAFAGKECTPELVLEHIKRLRAKGHLQEDLVAVQWDTGRISLAPAKELVAVKNEIPVKAFPLPVQAPLPPKPKPEGPSRSTRLGPKSTNPPKENDASTWRVGGKKRAG